MTRRCSGLLTGIALVVGVLLTGCSSGSAAPAAGSKQYSFWPEAPDAPHVQFLRSINTSKDVAPAKGMLDDLIYGEESRELLLNKPYGIRFWNGSIYVCDTSNRCVTILDLRLKKTRIIGASGSARMLKPVDIAISPDGIKYVADTQKRCVFVFDSQDRFVRQFAAEGLYPSSLAVWENELFVVDFKSNDIMVLDRMSGNVLRTIGEPGKKLGQFGGPIGIAVDNSGYLYVTEIVNNRVQKLSSKGEAIKAFGSLGDRPGTFTRPKHLAVDSEGIIYVVDSAFQNVQMFNADMKPLMFFGGNGTYPGSMDLPAGITVTDKDLDIFEPYVHPAFKLTRVIIVANQFGDDKVAIYGMGAIREGKTEADIAGGRADLVGMFQVSGKPETTGFRALDNGQTRPSGERGREAP